MSEGDSSARTSNRTDSNQNFSVPFGNIPVDISSQMPVGRNVSSMAQGFLPNFSQVSANPYLSSLTISEPSSVVNMESIDTQARRHMQNFFAHQGQGHNHGHAHGQGHNHGHAHGQGHGHSHHLGQGHLGSHEVSMPSDGQNNNDGAEGANALTELQQYDWRPFLVWFQKSGVFFVLLFIKFMYDHRLGLLVFFALGGTLYYANMKLVQFVHYSAVRESRGLFFRLQPLWLITFMSANIAILFYVFKDQNLWKLLVLKMPTVQEIDVWTLLWIVLLADYILKFSTVLLKALICIVPQICLPHKKRGKYFMFIEHLSQCYRQLIPIIPFLHFLSDDQDTARWFSMLCAIVYVIFKAGVLWSIGSQLVKAFYRFRSETNFGLKPSASDLKSRGDHCPICQDEYKEPVMLLCKHIFCENCVSVWFDRERTCPMCRAQITDNPMFQDGSTSMHLQWY